MSDIAVLYLCWAPAGVEPVKRFLESYQAHDAGVEHDLYCILNGYDGQEGIVEALRGQHRFRPPHSMLDQPAFHFGADLVQEKYIVPLSAYSRILHPGWLRRLYDAVQREGVGFVGCTGSWESHFSDQFAWAKRNKSEGWTPPPWVGDFPPFPNPHIRTSGCMMLREHWLEFDTSDAPDKMATLRMESGWRGMGLWMEEKGLRSLVVGLDGEYESQDWDKSRTFRQGAQENLLVADNQTDRWLQMSAEDREFYSMITWGQSCLGFGNSPDGLTVP